MKKIILFFASIIILTFTSGLFTSCSDGDGYSLSDIYKPEFATVNNVGSPLSNLIVGDSTIFIVGASNIPHYIPTQPRVILNYTILGDIPNGYLVKVNSVGEVITQPVKNISEEELENSPNDFVDQAAISISHQYINMRFSYNFGGSSANHNFEMYQVTDENSSMKSQNDTVRLHFRHNKNEDIDRWKQTTYRCFDLRSLDLEKNKKVILEVLINTERGIDKLYHEYTPFLEKSFM